MSVRSAVLLSKAWWSRFRPSRGSCLGGQLGCRILVSRGVSGFRRVGCRVPLAEPLQVLKGLEEQAI